MIKGKYVWSILNEPSYCYCQPSSYDYKCHFCREDNIMEEKAKVYNPLPDNVRPKSLSILEDEETRNFMGMNEVEFETFMNQLLDESSLMHNPRGSGLAND